MSSLRIPRFPFASYDAKTHIGFLSLYYPYDAKRSGTLTNEQWREGSHSPEILNFKDGSEPGIEWWIGPFFSLLDYVMKVEKSQSAILVPVPSSMPKTDKRYSRIPKPKPAPSTARSRDDRLIQFCTKLMQSNTASVQMIELIERTKYKPEKMGLSLSAHMATLRLCQVIQSQSHPPTIVLVDDVRTEGTTFAACESIILQGNQSAKVIIKLSLALSQNPSSFQDLRTQHERS
jgi:hypothetical protein